MSQEIKQNVCLKKISFSVCVLATQLEKKWRGVSVSRTPNLNKCAIGVSWHSRDSVDFSLFFLIASPFFYFVELPGFLANINNFVLKSLLFLLDKIMLEKKVKLNFWGS